MNLYSSLVSSPRLTIKGYVYLSLTMLYTLPLRSCGTASRQQPCRSLSCCSIQVRVHLSCVSLVPRTALCCFTSRGPLVALPAFTPLVPAIQVSRSSHSAVTNSSVRREFSRDLYLRCLGFLSRLSLLLGALISIVLIEPSACSWLCSFTSDRSCLQLAMIFHVLLTSLPVCFP